MEAERPAPYQVTILPTVLEVSARLATSEELRGLVKLLRASAAVIWAKTETKQDWERPSHEIPEEDLLTLRDIWRQLNSTASKAICFARMSLLLSFYWGAFWPSTRVMHRGAQEGL